MSSETLADWPVHALASRIRNREISPVELVEACLTRIGSLDRQLHAFADVWADDARAAAREAEAEILAGRYRGALHGIPIALKDLFEVKGHRASAGSLYFNDRTSTFTATIVDRLIDAGAIILGKVQMVEFAFGGWGINTQLGTPWNPWDLNAHRVPGGSSSGSGVAVSSGMVPVSIGSDTGGSIRIPASMNGIVGLKPTASNASTYGVFPLSQTLDSIGPLTRSVEDAAIVFASISGEDSNDPRTYGVRPPEVLANLKRSIEGVRLGIVPDNQLNSVRPDVLDAFHTTLAVLRSLGVDLVDTWLPETPFDYAQQASKIIHIEAYANLGDIIHNARGLFDPFVKTRVLAGSGGAAADLAALLTARSEATRRFHPIMAEIDALLLPTTPITAPLLDAIDKANAPLSDLTRMANYLGLCALAVPTGVDAAGLPLSLQIVGAGGREDRVLRIGWAFERARGSMARPALRSKIGVLPSM